MMSLVLCVTRAASKLTREGAMGFKRDALLLRSFYKAIISVVCDFVKQRLTLWKDTKCESSY